ncbi:hypothetical protein IG631_09961 [Alternaria alternata]|nr:hypothetical protein IG631_09961 [Alternaria alternata]
MSLFDLAAEDETGTIPRPREYTSCDFAAWNVTFPNVGISLNGKRRHAGYMPWWRLTRAFAPPARDASRYVPAMSRATTCHMKLDACREHAQQPHYYTALFLIVSMLNSASRTYILSPWHPRSSVNASAWLNSRPHAMRLSGTSTPLRSSRIAQILGQGRPSALH